MQSSEFSPFKAALQKTFALYDKPLNDVVLSVWWEALQPYALQEVTRALTAHIRNPDSGQYVPKPADVVKGLAGGIQNTAQAAWTKVDSAVRKIGPHRSVAFDDAIIHRVIADMGGWVRLNTKASEEWPFIQKEFETRYRGFAMTGGVTQYPAQLTGIAEDYNRREAINISGELEHKTNPVALIGNAQAAQAVIANGSSGPMVPITNRLTNEDTSEQRSGPARIGSGAAALPAIGKAAGGSSRH